MSRSFDLLVLDVDGTLVGASGRMTTRVARALRAAQEQGIRVCLCTGRSLDATRQHLQALSHPAPPVVYGGALVPDLGGGPDILNQPLAPATVEALVAYAREHDDYLELHTATGYYVERLGLEGEHQRRKLGIEPHLGPFDAVWQREPILKAQFGIRTAEQTARLRALEAACSRKTQWGWGVSPGFEGHLINVLAPGVSKEAAAEVILRHLGLTWARVFAAGDSPSDLAYVRLAGYGVVMGNAPEAVRRAAPRVCPSVSEDGLAQTLEAVILGDAIAGEVPQETS